MGKLSKSSKALIGFIVFLIVAFLIYIAISGVIASKRETMEGTDQTFGAVELPLNSELTGLGLDNSVISDHIDKAHQLHDYKIDLQKKAITYNYYTKTASYGDKFKVITYSTTQDNFEKNIVPKADVLDSGINGMSAKYFNGTYYYVSDNYKPTEQVQKALNDGKIIMDRGNETEDCEIGTVQALYWYDNGVGYCFEAINMPDLTQDSLIEMAGKYWNEGSTTDEE